LKYRGGIFENIPEKCGIFVICRLYSQVVCFFSQPTTQASLQCAFVDYQLLLIEKAAVYTFVSVKAFRFAFVMARMRAGQDMPEGWMIKDTALMDTFLIKHDRPAGTASSQRQQRAQVSSSASAPVGVCRKFNDNRCRDSANYKYTHICLDCHGHHPRTDCTSVSVSAANSIPLDGRVSKPGR